MKRPNYKAPLPTGAPRTQLRPTIADFYMEWFEELGSRWNRQGLTLIVDYVLACFSDDVTEEDRPSIQKAVLKHIQLLQKAHLRSQGSQGRRLQAISQARIRRKREVRPMLTTPHRS